MRVCVSSRCRAVCSTHRPLLGAPREETKVAQFCVQLGVVLKARRLFCRRRLELVRVAPLLGGAQQRVGRVEPRRPATGAATGSTARAGKSTFAGGGRRGGGRGSSEVRSVQEDGLAHRLEEQPPLGIGAVEQLEGLGVQGVVLRGRVSDHFIYWRLDGNYFMELRKKTLYPL